MTIHTQVGSVIPNRPPSLCLSVRQPWAWLIATGWKNIENREWPMRVRGHVLIHASKGMTQSEWFACCLFIRGFSWGPDLMRLLPEPHQLKRGEIIGEATILDCVTAHDSDWFTGPYGFVLADQHPLPFEPCKGALKFFKTAGQAQGAANARPDAPGEKGLP